MKVRTKFAALIALVGALVLSGCVPVSAGNTAEDKPKPSVAAPVDELTTPSQTPEADDMLRGFGEAITWVNDVSISVSHPTPFQPSEYAAGVVDGYAAVVFTIVLTNNSGEVYDPMVYNRVSSGGAEASSIFDTSNPVGEIAGSPHTAVLPGQTVQWLEAYSVADPAAITFETSPGFEYLDAIFTNIPQ